MPLVLGGSSAAAGPFSVDNSCRFNGDAKAAKTPGATGNRKTYTLSYWVKRSGLSIQQIWSVYSSSSDYMYLRFMGDGTLYLESKTGGSANIGFTTNRLFRDVGAWYHIVLAVDTAQAVTADRWKLYINGTQVTAFSASDYSTQDVLTPAMTDTFPLYVGADQNTAQGFEGYMAEVVVLDGTAATPSDFGEFDEDSPTIWKPIDPSGLTFGTNGFYLDFEDSANLGNDANGGTDLTETNLVAADQATDTPSNNFATLNKLVPSGGGFLPQTSSVLSEGNCFFETDNSSGNWGLALSNIGVTNGKWYFESKATVGASAQIGAVGTGSTTVATYAGSVANSYGYYATDGNSTTGGTGTSYGDTYTNDDIIGVYLDLDNNKIYWAKNGTVQNSGTGVSITAVSSVNLGAYFFGVGTWDSGGNGDFKCNFGGCSAFDVTSANQDANGYGNFEYDPSSGTFDGGSKDFLAICTKNLGSDGG